MLSIAMTRDRKAAGHLPDKLMWMAGRIGMGGLEKKQKLLRSTMNRRTMIENYDNLHPERTCQIEDVYIKASTNKKVKENNSIKKLFITHLKTKLKKMSKL